jgi:hypothetical protein
LHKGLVRFHKANDNYRLLKMSNPIAGRGSTPDSILLGSFQSIGKTLLKYRAGLAERLSDLRVGRAQFWINNIFGKE